jgi:threonine dehydrogenase-like Zn-dependent dehydrogenase
VSAPRRVSRVRESLGMKAVRVENGQPTLATVNPPTGEGVLINVASASICGSDFHLMKMGAVEGRIIGHEFAGTTPDGTAVAIEPTIGCGACHSCIDGERRDCNGAKSFMGIKIDGGMAEQVMVDPSLLVALPSGLDVGIAALIEPLAVAAHVVRRVNPEQGERVAVIGAGPIGLATIAILRDRGVKPFVFARHDHQKMAGEALGARLDGDDGFDVIFDAVGTTASIAEGVKRVKYQGRIGLAGTLWEPATIGMALWSKEVSIIPAAGYSGVAPNRDFDLAARVLAERPDIADVMVTHRFPLDGAVEGFATAADRATGAIKVLFEV